MKTLRSLIVYMCAFNFFWIGLHTKKAVQPACMVGANVNGCSHCVNSIEVTKKKSKIELPCETAISLLGIYLKEIK